MGNSQSNNPPQGNQLALWYPLPSSRSSSFSAQDNSEIHDECRTLVLNIKGHPDKKARLKQLEGKDAQRMVDFLSLIAHEEGILSDGRFVLSRLRDLAKKAEIFPHYYTLTRIKSDFQTVQGGAFADLCEGEYKSQKLALKMVRIFGGPDKKDVLKTFVKELTLWAHLSHANILPFYGVYLHGEKKRICLVSPWMNNGNLRDYLRNVPGIPRLPLISDVVEGLHYLHEQKVIHGDLKSVNVLISDDGRAMIGDFGLSYIAVASAMASSSGLDRGTARWAAPELLDNDARQTRESDIWSFGCLCYEVLTGKLPFYKLSDAQVVLSLAQSRNEPPLPGVIDGDGIDDQMRKIMKKCWTRLPSDRPTCDTIRRTIANIGIRDPRPKVITKAPDGLSFLQAMRNNSLPRVDYNRVREILQMIHKTQGKEIN